MGQAKRRGTFEQRAAFAQALPLFVQQLAQEHPETEFAKAVREYGPTAVGKWMQKVGAFVPKLNPHSDASR